MPQSKSLTLSQFVVIGPVTGVDAKGNPAAVTEVAFSVDDGSILAFSDIDAVTKKASAQKAGVAVVTVSGKDAAGNVLPSETVTLTVTADLAVSLVVPVSDPQAQ